MSKEQEKQIRTYKPMNLMDKIALASVPVSMLITTVMMVEAESRRVIIEESYGRSQAVIQGENWYATKIGEDILRVNGTARHYLWPNMPDTDLRTKQAREAVMGISQHCQVRSTVPQEDRILVILKEGTNCTP